MKIVKVIIFLLFGLMFIQAGLDKFFHFMPTPQLTEEQKKIFGAIMEIGWLLPLVAVVEITGGLLVIFPKTRALGAIIILPVMVGILLHNLKDTTGLPIAAPLALINLWMLIDNSSKYKNLIS